MSYGDWPKKFVGKTIQKIEIDQDGAYIRFWFNLDQPGTHAQIREALGLGPDPDEKNSVTFHAFGDCCSHSWIESFDGADTMVGEVVMSAESVELPEPLPTSPDHDVVQDYCWRFTTRAGHADLIFRNDSNGYYGGSLDETDYATDAHWTRVYA